MNGKKNSPSTPPPQRMANSFVDKYASTKRHIPKLYGNIVSQLEIGQMFRHYRLCELLGQGGMGIVYRVFDTRLKRDVALKLVSSSLITADEKRRFIEEARSTAQLQHPHIIRLFEVGEIPAIYFTMEYIEGATLATLLKDEALDYRKAADLLRKVALALHEAHKKGIIHRDLKPSNIMVDSSGEPRVMDFGLAKNTRAKSGLSRSGDIMGTPSYMSPEQARGEMIGKRSDIYSLGANLYEAISGFPPFQGKSRFSILNQIVERDPIPPRKFAPDAPAELEAICLKCLAKSPRDRYSSMRLMAKDLDNFLHGQAILAQRYGFVSRLRKFIIRNFLPIVAISLLILFIALTQLLLLYFSPPQQVLPLPSTADLAVRVDKPSPYREFPGSKILWQFSAKQRAKTIEKVSLLLREQTSSTRGREDAHKNLAQMFLLRAHCYFLEKQYTKAIVDWETAFSLDDVYAREVAVEYFLARGIVYDMRGFAENAKVYFDTATSAESVAILGDRQYKEIVRVLPLVYKKKLGVGKE